jgi:hypothetical protein
MASWRIAVRPRAGRLLTAALLAGLVGLVPASAHATPTPIFTVTSTNDTGSGSLRQAIMDSNAHGPGPNEIDFALSSGPQTISPQSALPPVTTPVTIDGTSQAGFEGTPLIRIDGASAGTGADGLTITAGSSTVKGLAITSWSGSGIVLSTNGSNTVTGDYLGTDGSSTLPNATGITLTGSSSDNSVGGTGAGDRNVISGNTAVGVRITTGTGNVVRGNFIGLNAAGAAALPNGLNGVLLTAGHNTVGGTAQGDRNVISGNGQDGVAILGGGGTANVVAGNFIGTSSSGTAALPNGVEGIEIFLGATRNTVGGATVAARNVISGNSGDGVGIDGHGTSGNQVVGNYVGTNAAGTAPVPNGGMGLAVFSGAAGNTLGGAAGRRNVVSGNDLFGVAMQGSGTNANRVAGNYVGTTPQGTAAMPNKSGGVAIYNSAARNTIGGTTAGTRNLISGNAGTGVVLSGAGTTGDLVEGNFIGSNAAGTAALGNAHDGVLIQHGATGNTIGGTAAGTGNTIAYNKLDGVHIDGSSTHADRVERNSIFTNHTKVGIALTNKGNGSQAAPVITRVTNAKATKITLRVPTGKHRVELFANPSCADPEGKRFVAATTLSGGTWTLTLSTKLPAGQGVTATATKLATANSSRFSACRRVP